MKINWDGTDIGDITPYVKSYDSIVEGGVVTQCILYLKGGERCRVFHYTNNLPLVVDEIKNIFDLQKIGKVTATLNKIKVFLYNYPINCRERYLTLEDLEKKSVRKQAIKVLLFRSFISLKGTDVQKFVLRIYDSGRREVHSYIEKDVGVEDTGVNKLDQKRLFNGRLDVISHFEEFCKKYTKFEKTNEIRNIIEKIDKKWLILLNHIKRNANVY